VTRHMSKGRDREGEGQRGKEVSRGIHESGASPGTGENALTAQSRAKNRHQVFKLKPKGRENRKDLRV